MKKNFKSCILLLAADLLILPGIASAQISDLGAARTSMILVAKTGTSTQSSDDRFGAMFKKIFGSESAQTKQRTCDDIISNSEAGMVGHINNLFCMLEHDLGIKTVGSVTKSDSSGAIHAEVRDGATTPITDGTTTYDYEAKIWGCYASSTVTCANATDFKRLIYVMWSYKPDGSVNKGKLLIDYSVFQAGTVDDVSYYSYNLGSEALNNSGSKSITMKGIGAFASYKIRLDATKNLTSGTALTVLDSLNELTTTKTRISASLSVDGLTGGSYAESSDITSADSTTGLGVLNATASGDAPANKVCFSRVPSGTDWTYSITSSTSCTLMNFPSDSCNAVDNYTTTSVSSSINSQVWNGMTANPSSI